MLAHFLLSLFLAQQGPDSSGRLQEALRLLSQGQPAQALEIVEDVLSLHGGLPEALVLKGLMLDALGRYEEAQIAYEAALRASPDDPNIIRNYGVHWMRRRQWERAVALFEQSLRLSPNDAETFFHLARARFEKRDFSGAVEAIDRCVQLAPSNALARQARERYLAAANDRAEDESARRMRRRSATQPAAGRGSASSRDPYALVQQAKALLDRGEFQGVLDIVDGLLKDYPRSHSSHLLRAMALDELGRYDEAKLSYEAALRIVPKDPQILTRFGMHFMRREALDDAIRYLEQSLAVVPDDVITLFYLAQAHFRTQNMAKAVEEIEGCVKLAPKNPTILLKLGEYRAHASKYAPALEALLKAQELNPEEPGLDLALGIVHLGLLDVRNARAALERAEQKDPENLAIISNLAEACAQARDHAAAKHYYQKLLDRGQHEARYYLGLGAALVGLAEYENSINALNQAVDQNPKLPEAHFHLARAYRALGRAEEAQQELRIFKALKENPFDPLEERTDLEQSLWRRIETLVKQGKEEEAMNLLGAGNAPAGSQPTYLIGALYYLWGRFQDAQRLLEETMKAAPTLPKLRAYLGLTYMELGRLDDAERVINEELAQNPKDPMVLMAVGQLHFRKKNWAEAARYLRESRVVVPEALLMLCEAQLETGQQAPARETAQIIVTLAADDEKLMAALNRLLARFKLSIDTESAQPSAASSS